MPALRPGPTRSVIASASTGFGNAGLTAGADSVRHRVGLNWVWQCRPYGRGRLGPSSRRPQLGLAMPALRPGPTRSVIASASTGFGNAGLTAGADSVRHRVGLNWVWQCRPYGRGRLGPSSRASTGFGNAGLTAGADSVRHRVGLNWVWQCRPYGRGRLGPSSRRPQLGLAMPALRPGPTRSVIASASTGFGNAGLNCLTAGADSVRHRRPQLGKCRPHGRGRLGSSSPCVAAIYANGQIAKPIVVVEGKVAKKAAAGYFFRHLALGVELAALALEGELAGLKHSPLSNATVAAGKDHDFHLINYREWRCAFPGPSAAFCTFSSSLFLNTAKTVR